MAKNTGKATGEARSRIDSKPTTRSLTNGQNMTLRRAKSWT